MAKWGEGDPRWIVEERPDATNVNNWHWTEKNASHWSRDKLKSLLESLVIEDPAVGRCEIKEITSIEGEAVANNRKGKLIFFYEWVIKCNWSGRVNGDDKEYTGKLEIPNLSEENSAEDITVDVSVDDAGNKKAELLKEIVRTKGLVSIQEQMKKYIIALRDEFASDMIKPTKFTDGGNINAFQTDMQLKQKKDKAPETVSLRDAPYVVPKPKTGVKIDTTGIRITDNFKCTAEEIYRVFTDPALMHAFTQTKVRCDPVVGGQFSLLDGNIYGKFTHLEPNRQIRQNWRVKNWPDEHYSEVTIDFDQKDDYTEVTVQQSGVPQMDLERTEEGWKKHYFESIKRTFGYGAPIF